MGDMSQTEFDGADAPIGYLLHRVVAVMRPGVNAGLRELGISLPELVCLRLLAANPGLTSADLARATNVSAQAMNQVLNRLEELGAVARPTVEARRTLPAQLTRQGKTLLKKGLDAAAVADRHLLDALSPAEVGELKRLLYKAGTSSESPDRAG